MVGPGAFADLVPEDADIADAALPIIQPIESGGAKNRATVVSPKGAVGIGQVMPNTAIQYGYDPEKLTDADYNAQVSRTILADLADRYKDAPNRMDAIWAGYNGGPGRGDALVKTGDPSVLPQETQDYILKANKQITDGAFSDLVPEQPALPSTGGAFDDLVPKGTLAPAADPFGDLVPKPAPAEPGIAAKALGAIDDTAARAVNYVKDGGFTGYIQDILGGTKLPDPTKPQDTNWESAKKNLENIPHAIMSSLGGIVQRMGEAPAQPNIDMGAQDTAALQNDGPQIVPPGGVQPESFLGAARENSGISRLGKAMAANAQKHIKENLPNVPGASISGFTNELTSGVAQMVPLMAASALTKSAAPLLVGFAGTAYGEKYAASRAAGRTPEQADGDATFSAAANALPAMLPLHAIMQPGKKFLGKLLPTVFSAATQNMLTTGLQNGYDMGVLNSQMTWGEAVNAMLKSGLIGAATGVPLAGLPVGHAGAETVDTPRVEPTAATPAAPAGDVAKVEPAASVPGAKINMGPKEPAAATVPEKLEPVMQPPAGTPKEILDTVHDPESWVQTGWKDKDGNILPLDDPRARAATIAADQPSPAGEALQREFPKVPQKGKPTVPPEVENPPVASFTTAKGSTYAVHPDGTTTRDKAARTDAGHEGQQGPQPQSQATFYVTPEHADELGLFQTQGGPKMAVVERPDGTAGVKYLDGNGAGKFEKRTVAPVSKTPEVGMIPVETWKDGTRVHFGNEITEVRPAELTPDTAKAALASNIDPATGKKPKGNAALRDFRARMQTVVDGAAPEKVSRETEVPNETPSVKVVSPENPKVPATKFDPAAYVDEARAAQAAGKGAIAPAALAKRIGVTPARAARVLRALAEAPPDEHFDDALARVRAARAPMPKSEHLGQAIRSLGGLKLKDNAGNHLAGGPEIRDILDKNPGLLNNKTGLAPDAMREALSERGWFSGANDAEHTSLDDLHEMLSRHVKGEKVYHPTSDAANALHDRAMQDEELGRAGVGAADSDAVAARKLAAFRKEWGDALADRHEDLIHETDVADLDAADQKVLHEDYDYEPGSDVGEEHEAAEGASGRSYESEDFPGWESETGGSGKEAGRSGELPEGFEDLNPRTSPEADAQRIADIGREKGSEAAQAEFDRLTPKDFVKTPIGAKYAAKLNREVQRRMTETPEEEAPPSEKFLRDEALANSPEVVEAKAKRDAAREAKNQAIKDLKAKKITQAEMDAAEDRYFKAIDAVDAAYAAKEKAMPLKTEDGTAVDGQGNVVPQFVAEGADHTARQLAKAREASGHGKIKPKAAQKEPAGGLFGEEPKAPETADMFAEKPAEKPSDYGTKNTVFTADAAQKARDLIRSKLKNQMNSGIDPEMVHAGITLAGYHIEAGARKFADFAKAMLGDLGEDSRPFLKMWYNAVRDYPGFDAKGMSDAAELTPEVIASAGKTEAVSPDVFDRSANSEQDRGSDQSEDDAGEASVSDEAGKTAPGAGRSGNKAVKERDAAQSGGGADERRAVPVGEEGDSGLREEEPNVSGHPAGPGERAGGGDYGDEGIQPDRIPAETVERSAPESAHVEENPPQNSEPSVDAPKADADLERALPTLFPEQRDDVAFAERRFEEPDGHGVLFTNGTGTGKTFTGGGIIKRAVDAGKDNVLVVAPTQGILDHWLEAAEKLGVPLKVLEDTVSNGKKGPVATTYANFQQNKTLADRDWDYVVADESHTLMSDQNGSTTQALTALRALTNHPQGIRDRARMQLRQYADKLDEMVAQRKALEKLKAPTGDLPKKIEAAYADLEERMKPVVEKIKAQARSKVAFLSATPFAYDKNVDYAEGYLFNYPAEDTRGGYNSGSPHDRFFMHHFGYRMKYNKLTKPEAAVQNDVMERQFHEYLRQQKVLSGRVLTVDKDYDRKFMLVDDGVGKKIDQALEWLDKVRETDKHASALGTAIRKRFDYLARMRLLEAIKATHAVPVIKKHMAMGRKVVVFHDFNEGGGFDPFQYTPDMGRDMRSEGGAPVRESDVRAAYDRFVAANPYVEQLGADMARMRSPLETLQRAFPDALVYNGTVSKKTRSDAKTKFNTDGGRHNLIVVQSAAGQAGISLHDTTGQHQRVLINLGMPGRPVAAIQIEGRTYRIGQASDAIFRYMNTGTNWERHTFASRLAERAGTAENLALGDRARTLRQSFIDAFNDSASYPPSKEDGRGGKETDRALYSSQSEFQRAKSFYYAQGKKKAGRANREGTDYYATPEPIGYKMVEWAGIRPGDKVLEPSAGHGAIARFFPDTSDRTLVEPSAELATRAVLSSPGADVKQHRFEDLHVVNKYDAIVMNPPFGAGGSTAIAHIAKAATHLRDGGRIVALIPEGSAADKKFEAFMESDAAKGLYQAGNIKLPVSTFERAGTKIHTRVVILERQNKPENAQRIQQQDRDFSDAENNEKLFDRIEHSSIRDRVMPAPEEAPAPAMASARNEGLPPAERPLRPVDDGSFDLAETKHTKTGDDLYVATFKNRVERDTYSNANSLAKRFGGYYSAFRGRGAIPGFQFKTAEARDAFVQAHDGNHISFALRREGKAEKPFYSALTKHIEDLKQERAPAQQWASIIENAKSKGVKNEEIEWSGVKDWLADQKGPVAKADLLQHLRENEVQIQEVQKGRTSKPLTDAENAEFDELSDRYRADPDDVSQEEYERLGELRNRADHEGANDTTKFSSYKLPGGENYRELLLTMPATEPKGYQFHTNPNDGPNGRTSVRDPNGMEMGTWPTRESAVKAFSRVSGDYKSSHWNEPNILAHVRFDDRTGPNGEKVLHLAEVQSDWHQAGRRKGYVPSEAERKALGLKAEEARVAMASIRERKSLEQTGYQYKTDALGAGDKEAYQKIIRIENSDPEFLAAVKVHDEAVAKARAAREGVPNAPFKSSWHELALKRMLRYAAEHGYDRVSWDTGETNADRYDLSRQIDSVHAQKMGDGRYRLEIIGKDGRIADTKYSKPEQMPDLLGKDLADKIVSDLPSDGDSKAYRGLDLKVGGEGMKGFYDKILPSFMNKYGKKFGAKVEESQINSESSGFVEKRYDGPELTARDVKAKLATAEGGALPVSVRYQIHKAIDLMIDGHAINSNEVSHELSDRAAEFLGGKMVETPTAPVGDKVHSIPVTDAMREGVMQGQPMFKMGTRRWKGGVGEEAVARWTPKFDAKRAEMEPILRKRLDQVGLKDVELELPDTLEAISGGESGAAEGINIGKLIAVAMDHDAPMKALNHESIHGLRRIGVLKGPIWDALERRAGEWRKKFDIDAAYGDIGEERLNEEAVAHAYPEFLEGKLGFKGNAIQRAFHRIKQFFEAVRNAFHGAGFKTAEDIFRDIDQGRLTARGENSADSNQMNLARKRAPEEEKPRPRSLMGKIDKAAVDHSMAVTKALGDAVDRIMPNTAKSALADLKEWARPSVEAIKMATVPMANGTPETRAAAKDFANGMREARVIGARQDDYLSKNFTPEQRKRMWDAADQESVALQEGRSVEGIGLSTLPIEERKAVEAFQMESNATLQAARDVGMFKGEGLPSYMPRMVIAMGADGKANRLGHGGDAVHGLDAIGRNLKTTSSNLKQRKHLTVEQTEEAAQAMDPNAVVVRDVRTLPLAMARLREAIAGRQFVNTIKEMGEAAGEQTISEGAEPEADGKYTWFTIDHPAMKTYRPKFFTNEETGKTEVLEDEHGNPLFERVPLYIRSDFEGPMRAVLTKPSGPIVKALMKMKGKTMSVIMYSPMMHNAVIWGKALPAAPLKLITPWYRGADGNLRPGLQLYGEGRVAKNNPVIMKEALRNGLDPIGKRFGIYDATGIVEDPSIKPGRSWTAQVLAYVPGLFDKSKGEAVKRYIDKAGDVWHNKFLWDLVGDLQMGLYQTMRDKAVAAGHDPQTAGRMAAHFANRYAGALPIEAMSQGARTIANFMLFSRSFTLTNLGAFKDVVSGLPRDVQAQILRDRGIDALNQIQGTARRKAATMLGMDIVLSHVGTFLAAYAIAWAAGAAFQAPSENEPDKKDRFLIGYQKDGTAIYGRLPTGKVGEDLQNWVGSPVKVGHSKLSPFGHLVDGIWSNDKGFGQKIYDPYDNSAAGYAKNMARVAEFAMESVMPISPFKALASLGSDKGETQTKVEQILLPMIGITVSKGAPGGPAMGQLYASRDEHEFQVGEKMPEIKEKIAAGDIHGATKMMTDMGMSRSYQRFIIKTSKNPRARLSKSQMREFMGYAKPDEKEKMRGFIDADRARRSTPDEEDNSAPADQHSELTPQDFKAAVKDGTVQRFAAAGGTWTREEAARAAQSAGMTGTAAILRSVTGPIVGSYQKSDGEPAFG